MWSAAEVIEQLDAAARGAPFALLAVERGDGSSAFIDSDCASRLERLRDLINLSGAAPIGILEILKTGDITFEIHVKMLKEYSQAPDHVKADAASFLQRAVKTATGDITARILKGVVTK